MDNQTLLFGLIVFALFMNILGFLFWALSLKNEKKVEKDYDLPINEPYLREKQKQEDEEASYQFRTMEEEYGRQRQLFAESDEEPPYRFKQEPVSEPEIEPEPEPDHESMYKFEYKPEYEQEPELEEEPRSKYQFNYEPEYETEEAIEQEESKEETDENGFKQVREVDYYDAVKPMDTEEDENAPRFDGEYQFKHAYSKEERYKYEYDDYKLYNQTENKEEEEQEEEAFDYNIDIDKEHEKYYGGSMDEKSPSRYELYLRKDDEQEEKLKAMNEPQHEQRKMYQQTDILKGVPETSLDKEEKEREDTIDIKQFEPRKYEQLDAVEKQERKNVDEFNDEEVDKRIEYLMGKMRDPFQHSSKSKNPLDEEF